MGHRVGPKGQVVISKPTRERLGIEPGWEALERVFDDHVELYFVPPPHAHSLKGVLAGKTRKRPRTSGWARAREAAWPRAAREDERRQRRG
jgi:bifunctional DNA-binding transcriptional regulator/antitoxin component of YhaV-PrlF toxin-antitoxin module